MLTLEVIENEIKTLIEHGTNYADCERLANLYICRAGILGEPISVTSRVTQDFASHSEFSQAVAGAGQAAWQILDDMAEVMQAVNPNLYAGVMRNLKEAGQ